MSDNVRPTKTLQNFIPFGCGDHTYRYVNDFLSDRKAIIRMGDSATQTFLNGVRGMPQGAVLSLLFNIALIGLPSLLDNIPGMRHDLYAGDVTIRMSGRFIVQWRIAYKNQWTR